MPTAGRFNNKLKSYNQTKFKMDFLFRQQVEDYWVSTIGIYIYKAEKPSVCLSSFHSYQSAISRTTSCIKAFFVPNEALVSGYFKFVIAIWCGIQLLLCSGLNIKQHSTENHRKIAELLERVISKHEVVGLNPGSETFFFKTSHFLYTHFFKCQLCIIVT